MSDLDFDEEFRYDVINSPRSKLMQKGIASYMYNTLLLFMHGPSGISAQDWAKPVRKVIKSGDFLSLGVEHGVTVALHGLEECGFSAETMAEVIGALREELASRSEGGA